MINLKNIFKMFICIILIILLSNKYYANGFDETKAEATTEETSDIGITDNEDNDEDIASLSEIKYKKSESENYGDTNAWMYWYLTDSDKVLHLTSTYDENYEMITCGALDKITYEGLNIDSIQKVVIDNEINAVTCNNLFCGFITLEKIVNLNYLNTKDVLDMSYMFYDCFGLEIIDVSNFDTSKVENFENFLNTSMDVNNLIDIDVKNFNTSNAVNMKNMFAGCRQFESLDVGNFDTSKVTDFSGMFSNCENIKYLDVSNFVTICSDNMEYMFRGCKKLSTIDISNFDTSSVTSFGSMFSGCSSLTSIDVSNFDTSKVTDFGGMFSDCSSLTSINVSNFDTSSATSFGSMFSGCSGLTSIDVSNFNTSSVTSFAYMFSGCSGLTSIDMSNFDTSSTTSFSNMFSGCSGLTSIDVSKFNTSYVTSFSYMFSGCSGLSSIGIKNFNTSNSTDFSGMFENCSGLQNIDVSNFDTSKATRFGKMFRDCSDIKLLNISNFNTQHAYDLEHMFSGCAKLKTIYVSDLFSTENIDEYEYNGTRDMFVGCIKLVGGNGTVYDSNHVDDSYAMIDKNETPGYFTSINDYVAPSEDNDNKDPSSGGSGKNNNSQSNKNNNGGGSGGSGGGGGGGSSDLLPQNNNQIIDVHRISYDKTISKTIDLLKCRWVKDLLVNKWQLFFEDGSKAINGFYIINSIKYIDVNNVKTPVVVQDTYYFDDNGYMITGWLQTKDEKWYFFDISDNEDLGKMIVGWKEVQGSYYYFNLDGTMMTGGITPDGYTIGADGKWMR